MISGYFEKNAYAPSEIANVICEIDNSKCSLSMRDISFCFINKTILTSDQGE